jgi:predicted SAM-dependent methyltransferase
VKTYVNLGCGSRYHPEWTNIDIVAHGSGVIAHDLSKGIPLRDHSADVVYHTAVLEHIRKADALRFMKECHRVLKPRGVIRVGVPDLECICRLYLEKLEAAAAGEPGAADDYDWMLLEMFDQMVRERSGGDMLEYLRKNPLPNEQFVYERIGHEGREIVESIRSHVPSKRERPGMVRPVYRRIRALARKSREMIWSSPAGRDSAHALAIGRFRLGGEVHQSMYDRFSLARLLIEAGFSQPTLRSATESAIPDWSRFHLDTRADGTLNKPDLFFMEAVKPDTQTNA